MGFRLNSIIYIPQLDSVSDLSAAPVVGALLAACSTGCFLHKPLCCFGMVSVVRLRSRGLVTNRGKTAVVQRPAQGIFDQQAPFRGRREAGWDQVG